MWATHLMTVRSCSAIHSTCHLNRWIICQNSAYRAPASISSRSTGDLIGLTVSRTWITSSRKTESWQVRPNLFVTLTPLLKCSRVAKNSTAMARLQSVRSWFPNKTIRQTFVVALKCSEKLRLPCFPNTIIRTSMLIWYKKIQPKWCKEPITSSIKVLDNHMEIRQPQMKRMVQRYRQIPWWIVKRLWWNESKRNAKRKEIREEANCGTHLRCMRNLWSL